MMAWRKLNLILVIIGVVIALIVIFYVVFSSSTTTSSVLHTVVFQGETIYTGNTIPSISSDGVSNVLLGTSSGLFLYDTSTKTTTKLNTSVATGLAYDGRQFMELQADGTLFSISLTDGSLTEIGTGYTSIYDTIGGYAMTVTGVTSFTGSSEVRANGNYGTIQLTIR